MESVPDPDHRRVELTFDLASTHPSGTLTATALETSSFESWAELFSQLDEALENLRNRKDAP
jgi:hypothetical protein